MTSSLFSANSAQKFVLSRTSFGGTRDYLGENNLEHTQQTADVEFPDFANQYVGLTGTSSSERLQQVLELQSDHSFSDHVDERLSGEKGKGTGSAEPVPSDEPIGKHHRARRSIALLVTPTGRPVNVKAGSKAPLKTKGGKGHGKAAAAKAARSQLPPDDGDESLNRMS
jgi:hypothetical protein